MKITSKRGRKPPVEVKELAPELESFDLIVVDPYGMTPEEKRQVEEVFRELRRQLEDIGQGTA
jgi:hypothetical protein